MNPESVRSSAVVLVWHVLRMLVLRYVLYGYGYVLYVLWYGYVLYVLWYGYVLYVLCMDMCYMSYGMDMCYMSYTHKWVWICAICLIRVRAMCHVCGMGMSGMGMCGCAAGEAVALQGGRQWSSLCYVRVAAMLARSLARACA